MRVASPRASIASQYRAKIGLLIREGPGGTSGEFAWAVCTGVAVVVLITLRLPSAWTKVRGEEGGIFLDQAINHGFRSFGHFYSGYLDTVPRIGGALAAALPLRWAAIVMTAFTLLVIALCAGIVEFVSGTHLSARWLRVGLGLSFALLPALRRPGVAGMQGLQCPLTFTAFWMLLWLPRRRAGQVFGVVFVVGAALSSFLPFVLVPLALMRLLARKGAAIGASFLGAVAFHEFLVVVFRPTRGLTGGTIAAAIKGYGFDVLRSHLFGGPFNGSAIERIHYEPAIVLLLLAAAGTVVTILVSTRTKDRDRYLALIVAALGVSLVLYFGEVLTNGKDSRYATIPALLLTTAVAAAIDCAGRAPRRVRDLGRVVLVAAVCVPWIWSFSIDARRMAGPQWIPSVAAAKRLCAQGQQSSVSILTLPQGGHYNWYVHVPCRRLRS